MASKKQPAKKNETRSESKKSAGGGAGGGGGAGASGIDTNVAANAAAAMVGGKVALPNASAGAGAGQKKESAAFKQLKAGLNKPSAGALGGVFGGPAKQKKAQQAFGGPNQIGHNQTFGSDATRTGVPRRTPG